ncbi:EamA family transporter [Pedomonas mirosovicensis]|uniref:EamA family transporter n=1 Tax=Pedomonas mirosovicensis TaxID=2908641 RepID=UPI002168A27D|nr:EamA family transporter [Pedomonas mirosovicensis]MCH8686486.1 EamA family transporter [Pedomonas mirosovicensis]
MSRASLSFPHFLLALAIVAVWGTNFVVIRFGLNHLPPLLFAALRFAFAFFPTALFVRRPKVPLGKLAAYGLAIGAGQFGLLFIAMKGYISPGLASLVVQSQAFFTIGLAILLIGERLRAHQWVAVGMAASGIGLIAWMGGGDATLLGLALVLLAGLSWAAGNLIARSTPGVNMVAYVVWSSLFAIPPLVILSLVFEGPQAIMTGLTQADAATWGAVLWQTIGNSLFGYAAFGWLLSRYPAATVAPMSLLVPVFGMGASAWWLGESLPAWKLAAAAIVLGGLAVNLFWRPRPAAAKAA